MMREATVAQPHAASAGAAGKTGKAVPASLLALMILTQLPGALTLTVTAPLLAAMAHDLVRPGEGDFLVKMVTGIVGPAMIVGAPFGGWLADRHDRRPLLVAFGAVYIVSAVMPAFLSATGAIVAARFVSGATGGALATIGLAMVGHYYGDERRPGIIGIMAFATLITSVATLPVAGAAAATGWRNAFYIFLAMIPLVVLALLRPLPAPAREASREPAAGRLRLSRLPRMPFALLVIAVVMGLALSLPGILYSFYFTELGVKSVGTIALLLTYQAAVAGAATLLFGRASRRLSPTAIFVVCFTCSALGLGIQGLTSDYRVAGISLTLTGLAMGWLVANLSAATITLVDERQHGAALGIAQALAAVATLLGISEPLQHAIGTRGIFLGIAVICALVMLGLATRLLPLRRVDEAS
jgi:predicted MFS family arabinose efflux permease